MSAESWLIRGQDLSLSRGGREVLQQVSLQLAPAEILTLIGPNGAGKTTLVRMLLGLLKPDRGQISRRPGLRVGYMPQRVSLDPALPLTVARLLGLTRRISRGEAGRALAEVGAGHLLGASVRDLSGGELQRVLLARCVLGQPDLLVLDEPTQGVDFAGEAELYRLIADLRRRHGCGVLMVSHDLHLVMAATDRVVCLNHHVCCDGAPASVQRHPQYLNLFGHRLAADLAVYTHHHDHRHDLSGEVREDTAPAAGEGRR